MDQGQGADVIGVGMGEEDGVERSAFLDLRKIGKLVAFLGPHANAGIDQDTLSGDFEQGAGGADFIRAPEKSELHAPTVLGEEDGLPFEDRFALGRIGKVWGGKVKNFPFRGGIGSFWPNPSG